MDISSDMIITSASNDKVKAVKKLMKSVSERRDTGTYVVEGIRMFREIPSCDIVSVFVAYGLADRFDEDISDIPTDKLLYVKDNVFAGMAGTNSPQGIMAVVKMKKYKLQDICGEGEKPFILIADRIQDPGNMGTILRSAEAAGVTGIIISRDTVDIYNPKVVRSTMGSIFRMKVYVSDDLCSDIDLLKKRKITIYGAHLDGEEIYRHSFDSSCAFLIGNEGNGLSSEVSAKADKLIRIPMEGQVESLNAAVSTAIISYEVLRQRKF